MAGEAIRHSGVLDNLMGPSQQWDVLTGLVRSDHSQVEVGVMIPVGEWSPSQLPTKSKESNRPAARG